MKSTGKQYDIYVYVNIYEWLGYIYIYIYILYKGLRKTVTSYRLPRPRGFPSLSIFALRT